jgi:hypothetical protein
MLVGKRNDSFRTRLQQDAQVGLQGRSGALAPVAARPPPPSHLPGVLLPLCLFLSPCLRMRRNFWSSFWTSCTKTSIAYHNGPLSQLSTATGGRTERYRATAARSHVHPACSLHPAAAL